MTERPLPIAQQSMSPFIWGVLIALGIIWGSSFFFSRIAVLQIPPLTLVLLRVLIAAIVLHIYLSGRYGFYSTLLSRWREFAVLGTINNAIPFTLIFAGQTEIGAGLASILNACMPLWTIFIANRFTDDEKMTVPKIIGCLLGLAGTVVLIGPSAFTGLGAPIWAQLAIVGATISYGFAVVYGKRFKGLPSTVTATGQLTASTLVMLPLVLLVDRPWTIPWPTVSVVLSVAMLAVVCTALAYIMYFRILRDAGATSATLVTLLVPPSAIILGYLFLGERIGLGALLGLLLIVSGLLVIDGRLNRILGKIKQF